jgi:hypothetical protein
MSKVFFNIPDLEWSASNGATRRNLKVVNAANCEFTQINSQMVIAEVSLLDKGNSAFIFMNAPKVYSKTRVIGIFLCTEYGYRLVSGKEIFAKSSVGGGGNCESKFGVYELGAVIATDSYKSRSGETFYRLTETGWVNIPETVFRADEQIEI